MDWLASQFAMGEYARGRRAPPPQTGQMTVKKLAALIKAGYGQGHFQRYKPWLRVTKRDYSPNSVVGHLPAIALGRAHHFRSIAERDTIRVVKWLGAADVRDAYPVWPWGHDHPECGLPGVDNRSRLPGLLEIATSAKIAHGCYVGTAIPYVATLDQLTTWRQDDGRYRLVAFENKPEGITFAPDPLMRAKERLELTRRYCQAADIRHRIVHAEKLPRELVVNLDLLEPRLTTQQLQAATTSSVYQRVVDVLNARGYDTQASELLTQIRHREGCSGDVLTAAFHLAIWRQDVDHDLSLPLRPWEPLRVGGVALKRALFDAWVGGTA